MGAAVDESDKNKALRLRLFAASLITSAPGGNVAAGGALCECVRRARERVGRLEREAGRVRSEGGRGRVMLTARKAGTASAAPATAP
jgi:hypothetical protein